jgi:hypothetical protein
VNSRNTFGLILTFIAHILLQVFFAQKITLFEVAFCFIYVNYLLTLPYTIGRVNLLLIAFLLGVLIDGFRNTLGINAAACVLIAYIRPYWVQLLATRSNVDKETLDEVSIRETNFVWFSLYTSVLIVIHHFVLFFLEAFSMRLLLLTLEKVALSSIFTFFCVILIQYLFYSSNKK